VVSLIKIGMTSIRQSNIIFVCGGNDPNGMRKRFKVFAESNMKQFLFFEPEFAMKNYMPIDDQQQFDITDFEYLVAKLSHSIVLFPEAPGSFAETGYFSAFADFSKKTLLVIDSDRQKTDSFISLGPAKKIQESSIFHPNIQLSYKAPDFSVISNRLNDRMPLSNKKKYLKIGKFSETSAFDVFCIIYQFVTFMIIATIDDIEYMLKALFGGIINVSISRRICSVIVGSGLLREIGDFGHLMVSDSSRSFLEVRDGLKKESTEIGLGIAAMIAGADAEFRQLIGRATDVN
jgi:hypothetical protein